MPYTALRIAQCRFKRLCLTDNTKAHAGDVYVLDWLAELGCKSQLRRRVSHANGGRQTAGESRTSCAHYWLSYWYSAHPVEKLKITNKAELST